MNEKSAIARHFLSQVKAMRECGGDKTSPDAPEAESLGADFWKSTRVVMPPGKTSASRRNELVLLLVAFGFLDGDGQPIEGGVEPFRGVGIELRQ